MATKPISRGLIEPPGGGVFARTELGTSVTEGPGDLDGAALGPFTLQAGQLLVLAEVHDQANSTAITGVTWGGNALASQAQGAWGSATDYLLSVWSLIVPAGATDTLLIFLSMPLANAIILIGTAYTQVTSAAIDVTVGNDGLGPLQVPDSGFSAPTAQANELLTGYVGLETSAVPTGNWADSMINGQKARALGIPINLYESYRTVSAIAAYRARKVDAVNPAWEARLCSFRMT